MLRLTLAAALLSATGAAAQAAPGKFTTQEAARCGAVFARIVEAMKTAQDVPEDVRTAALLGLTFWEYELSASAPGEDEMLRNAVVTAFNALANEMPDGDDQAQARGAFLMERASVCSDEIDAAYPSGEHPALAELQAEVDAEAKAAGEDGSEKPSRSGLR